MSDRPLSPKRWGYEDVVVNKPQYCGKVLHVACGHGCSWHYHRVKDETFYVVSGRLTLRYHPEPYAGMTEEHMRRSCYTQEVTLEQGASFHVPPGLRHQFHALTDVVLVEFSTEHREEDTVRLVEGY